MSKKKKNRHASNQLTCREKGAKRTEINTFLLLSNFNMFLLKNQEKSLKTQNPHGERGVYVWNAFYPLKKLGIEQALFCVSINLAKVNKYANLIITLFSLIVKRFSKMHKTPQLFCRVLHLWSGKHASSPSTSKSTKIILS